MVSKKKFSMKMLCVIGVVAGTSHNSYANIILRFLNMWLKHGFRWLFASCSRKDVPSLIETEWCIYIYICCWFRQWLVAWSAASHYLNQCWSIVNLTFGNKFQLNFNQNSNIFLQQNTCEKDVYKMVSIWSRTQCVNTLHDLIISYWLSCP